MAIILQLKINFDVQGVIITDLYFSCNKWQSSIHKIMQIHWSNATDFKTHTCVIKSLCDTLWCARIVNKNTCIHFTRMQYR